jgi:glycogen debranching enzyme
MDRTDEQLQESLDRAAVHLGITKVPGRAPEIEGAPFVPAEARAELLALKSGRAFVCTHPDGDIIASDASGAGFYAQDTRHLSELRLKIGGHTPVLLASVIESGSQALINATNPWLRDDAERPAPQETINIRRLILIAERLHYRIRLNSFARTELHTTLALTLNADFADVFEVRGSGQRARGELLPARRAGSGVRFAFRGIDGTLRETLVALDPPSSEIELDGQRALICWNVTLAPNQAQVFEAQFAAEGPEPLAALARGEVNRREATSSGSPNGAAAARPAQRRASVIRPSSELRAREGAERRERTWRERCTQIESGNELFDRLLDASLRDLYALLMPAGDDQLPAAGIPWYVAPFGRDSIITALQSLIVNPEIARGTLRVLARLQANADDPFRDAEPGKILHELRTGELARLHQIPHTPYYGTVDATPLFLILAASYYSWTLDRQLIEELRPALDGALSWIDEWGDRDGDGFVEYERRSPAGLLNQGWKDSEDSVIHPDGSPAQGPIALVEVQGYVYAAKSKIAEIYALLGDEQRASQLRAQASTLREQFNEAFWNEQEGYFALALDGAKRQVRTITSNPAHCLWTGIVDEQRAEQIAQRLMAEDMFSGWGIRTLAASERVYNPMSYHNGSVWPHDNAIAAAGLKRYGFNAAAQRVAASLFDVGAAARDYRLPELLCGFARNGSRQVVSYPVACTPQAWAAAAPMLLLEALLGICAQGDRSSLAINQPLLPAGIEQLCLRGMRVGNARVSLAFRRTRTGNTSFELLDQEGEVRVTMAAAAP